MFPQFDPSKMDPKVLMELSQLIQTLPPEKLNQMQTLMHNMMAGHDVRREMEEFEKSLPPGFREKLMSLALQSSAATGGGASPFQSTASRHSNVETAEIVSETEPRDPDSPVEMNEREARLTILRAVAEGRMSAEEAERLL